MVVKPAEDVEVVISGIGGYFPNAGNIEELQKVLMEHIECIDNARWKAGQLDVCDKTGNVSQINLFDASYFGIHRQQSLFMDPMCRMTLQNTLEAVIDAGVNPTALRGRRVMVCSASSVSENDSLMFESVENGFGVTGQARAMMANRISYWLNVNGPSYACDATWIGGFQALHHGYHAVRNGECEAAILTVANLVMNIYPTYLYKAMKVTSADGVTRAFDENADGYARSDGTCVLFLQRADEARRRYATIENVDVMFNGCRPGHFTNIDLDCARRFLTKFYKTAGIDPTQVDYVESYGCGIKTLDKLELQLLDHVFNNGERVHPLLIGAVKTNLGHSEASAAFMSLVKAIISMESGVIAANRHCENPISGIPGLTEGQMKLVNENTPWDGTLAAINGFGLASSFGHALLRRNPLVKKPEAAIAAKKLPLLHVLASRTEDGIKEIIEKVKDHGELDLNYMHLMNDVFSTPISGYFYRGYALKSADLPSKDEIAYVSGVERPLWFVYSGMGSQWLGMGKSLMELPIFASAVNKCAAALKPFDVDLIHILTSDDKTIFDNILNSFVGIAAVQIGLTDLLTAMGVEPDGIVGHSVGELGCAYADGCLTAEQMILSAYYRGRASLEATLIPGLMAAVGIGATEAATKITPTIDVACHNGPDSCTLSGPKEDMEVLVKELQDAGVFARLVNVAGIAYHGRYIKPAAPLLLEYLHKLIPNPKERSSKWLSTSVPQAKWNTELARSVSAEYLTNNLLSSVLFEEALRSIPKGAVLVEIAPHGLLQAILRRSVPPETENIALTKRGSDNGVEFLFASIGKMFNAGIEMNLSALYKEIYPIDPIVPRGTPSLASLVRWSHTETWRTGLDEFKDYSNSEQTITLDPNNEWFKHITGHAVSNTVVIPVTAYLPLVCLILSNSKKVDAVEFTNVLVKKHRKLPTRDQTVQPVRVMVQRGTGMFELSDRYGIVTSGQAVVPDTQQQQQMLEEFKENKNDPKLGEKLFTLTGEEVYRELKSRGLTLTGIMQAITELHVYKNGVEASVMWKNNWTVFTTSVLHTRLFHPSCPTVSLVPGYIRRLAINFENLPQEDTVIQVRYTGVTDILSCPLLKIECAVCIPVTGVNKQITTATATRFVPHQLKNEELDMDLTSVIDVVLQIARRQTGNSQTEMQVIAYNNPSMRIIRNIVKNSTPKVDLHIVESLSGLKAQSLPPAALVIVDAQHQEEAENYIRQYPECFVFVCSEYLKKSEMIEVFSCQVDGCHLRLLKQACKDKPVVVTVTEKIINNEDLKNTTVTWVRDLQTRLTDDSIKHVYLECHSLPTNDIDSFVKYAQNLNGGHKLRFVFTLDKNVPKLVAGESFYSRIFKQSIIVSVYENGRWGSRYSSTLNLTDKDLNAENNLVVQEELVSQSNISVKVKNVDVRYVGIHSASVIPVENDDKSGTNPKLGLVDYCGTKKGTNSKIMGICDGTLRPDPAFQWSLPDAWTFVDGATVPAPYALAYYTLMELCSLEPGETVLVHNACSATGQAMIRVAYSIGAKVFASVATDRQRALLLQHMRMLTDENVFDYTTTKFERQIMDATQGDGVRVLINCVQGERLLAGLRCIATLGRAVMLQDEKDPNGTPNTETIGLSTFFRCVGMYGVHPARLCEINEDIKKSIHKLVQDGLDAGHVVPIRRNIFRHQEPLEHIIRYVTGPQVTGSAVIPIQDQPSQTHQSSVFRCNSNKTYIVYGADVHDIESACHTAVWLSKQGATKLLLVVNPQTNVDRTFLQRQMETTNAHYEVVKTLLPPQKLTNVAGVIVLPGNKVIASDALPKGTRIIMCVGTSSPSSLPPQSLRSTVRWGKKSSYLDAIPFLGHALSKTVDLVILSEESDEDQIVEETFNYKDFFRLLAESVTSITNVSTGPVDSVSMKNVATNGLREIRELAPLFIIPGLMGDRCRYLQQTISKLMCPAYVINAEQKNLTLEQLAAVVVERIREVDPKGPYNVAGVSTGGMLALEVTKHLEEIVGGSNVQLFLLDAIPATLQHVVREAQGSNTAGVDGVVLQNFMHRNKPELVNEIIAKNKTWSERLSEGLNLTDMTRMEAQQATQTLNMIRDRLNKLLSYKPNTNPQNLNATIRLLRPRESNKDVSDSIINASRQMKVEVIKGNHFTMLESQLLADYINENYIVPVAYN